MPRLGDDASMIALAHRQVEYAREQKLPGHGGELIISHIDRDSISTSIAQLLSPFPIV